MPLTKQRPDLHKRHCPCKPWSHSRIPQVPPCMPSDSSWVLILTLETSLWSPQPSISFFSYQTPALSQKGVGPGNEVPGHPRKAFSLNLTLIKQTISCCY